MENHFKLIDLAKNLLLNSINDEQIEQSQRILDLAKKQEKFLEINY